MSAGITIPAKPTFKPISNRIKLQNLKIQYNIYVYGDGPLAAINVKFVYRKNLLFYSDRKELKSIQNF